MWIIDKCCCIYYVTSPVSRKTHLHIYIQSYMGCSSTNIISMESAVIECFGPLIHEHSHSGWAHSDDQSLCVGWCFQLFSSRLSHNQLDARSAAWLSFWIAFRFALPVVPTVVISQHMDCEQNFLTPTSTGNSQVRYHRCLQRSTSSVNFAFFLFKSCLP